MRTNSPGISHTCQAIGAAIYNPHFQPPPKGVHPARWRAMIRNILVNDFKTPDNTTIEELRIIDEWE